MINKSDNESCPEGYVLPAGQNSSPRMKFNSQTKPLTTFSLLLTICHAVQIHTFRLVATMAALTNLRIGTEHKKWDWVYSIKKRRNLNQDKGFCLYG